MDIQDIFTYLAFNNSVHISSIDDFDNLNELLDTNFAENGLFLSDDDPLEQAVKETIQDEAFGTKFDEGLTRKALELGIYPMATIKRITNFKEAMECGITPEAMAEAIGGTRMLYADIPTFKHHSKKLIIPFDRLHITKKLKGWLKGKFADYTITFNRNFDLCIEELLKAYPETWITKSLIKQYKKIHENPDDKVSVDSVEIWHNGKLVAGEIGFITRNAYASLSGFHNEDDIGTVQMCVLGLFLKNNGFAYWDLGMELEYKYRYGAVACNRNKQKEYYSRLENKKAEFPKEETPLSSFLEYLKP